MKFKCALFLYIIPILTITAESFGDATDGKKSCSISRKEEKQCRLYAYKVVKPLLNYIHGTKEQLDNNDILTVKKDKQINELQNKVNQLQQKVSDSVLKDQQIESNLALYKKITDEKITELQKQNNTITIKLQESQKQNSSYIAKLSLKDNIITNLKETQVKLKDTIQKLNKQIKDDASKHKQNENQLKLEIESTIKEKNNIIQNLDAKATKTGRDLQDTQVKLKDTIQKLKQNENQLKLEIASTIKAKNNIIQNLDAKATKTGKDLQDLQDTQVKLKDTIQKLKQNENQLKLEIESNVNNSKCKVIQTRQIEVPGIDKFDVLSDSKAAGPGWIVIQQRINGEENFNRNFQTYQNGFGSFDGDFFLGLEKIHRMTSHQQYQLYIHMEAFDGSNYHACYDHFAISGKSDQYTLMKADGYSGNSQDKLRLHKNNKFYTYDRHNGRNCDSSYYGGWWYGNVLGSNLNGYYFSFGYYDNTSIFWSCCSALRKVKMLIRPKVN